jgi:hypothetical protein
MEGRGFVLEMLATGWLMTQGCYLMKARMNHLKIILSHPLVPVRGIKSIIFFVTISH